MFGDEGNLSATESFMGSACGLVPRELNRVANRLAAFALDLRQCLVYFIEALELVADLVEEERLSLMLYFFSACIS